MRIKKLVVMSVLLASFYVTNAVSQTADLTIEVRTDSQGTKGRNYKVTQYQDAECSKHQAGTKLFKKKFAKDQHQFKKIDITAGQDFFFQVHYQEFRRDQHRSCSHLTRFSPEPQHSYKAVYEVSGQVSRCSITVTDLTDPTIEVAVTKPASSCLKANKKGGRNAVPTHSIHQLF